jgi:glycine betaine/choline ABC-type transport system substrate-binding protein
MTTAHRRVPLRLAAAAATALALIAALAACGSSDPTAPASTAPSGSNKIVVGSFAFPESEILGEIYAQALRAKGVEVETKFNIGPRQQTIPALRDGSINLIPEYNGNLLAFYNPEYTERTTADVDKALGAAVAKDKLRVLTSATAEDKDAYVVTKKTATDKGLTQIGDLSKLVPFKLGSNPQFGELGYGIPGLKTVYGVGTEKGQRTFRVDRIVAAEPTGEAVVRPEGFDLAEAWQAIAAEVSEQRTPVRAEAEVHPDKLWLIRTMFGNRVVIGPAGPDGWVPVELRGHLVESLAGELAGLGAGLRVVSPPELRERLALVGRELVELYA